MRQYLPFGGISTSRFKVTSQEGTVNPINPKPCTRTCSSDEVFVARKPDWPFGPPPSRTQGGCKCPPGLFVASWGFAWHFRGFGVLGSSDLGCFPFRFWHLGVSLNVNCILL